MVTLLQLDSCASHLIAAQFVHRSPFRNLKENLLHLFHVIHVFLLSLFLLSLSLFIAQVSFYCAKARKIVEEQRKTRSGVAVFLVSVTRQSACTTP